MDRERLKIDSQPIKLRIESEPYAKFLSRKYCVVIDVFDIRKKREFYLIIDAQSLSGPIHELRVAEGDLRDIEIWVSKETEEKYAKYEVALA